MKKKNIKEPFLEDQSENMIEMEDFSYPKNPYSSNQYSKHQSSDNMTKDPNKLSQNSEKYKNPYVEIQYQSIEDQPSYGMIKKQNQSGEPEYICPEFSVSTRPNQINMNGSTFQIQESQTKRKKTKLPQMNVTCQWCQTSQVVAGNLLSFCCDNCQNINECEPTYGVFVCGDCQSNVCYAYRTSELIKCTKCGTINKVPKIPKRKQIKEKMMKKKEKKKEKIKMYKESDVKINLPKQSQYTELEKEKCNFGFQQPQKPEVETNLDLFQLDYEDDDEQLKYPKLR